MTDYSKLDETTLRAMLDASCDLDERQQLRSVLRRLKKHSNTISYSPTNRENNIMSKNSNNLMSLTDRWEQQIKSSSSPIHLNRNLPRRSTGIDKNVLSSISNCNLEVKDKSVNRNIGKTDRSVLQVIGNRNRNQIFGSSSDLNGNRSLSVEGNIYRSVENLKQTLGKTLSEPIRVDDSKLARSRLVIQQMLAPRLVATAKPGDVQETTAPITLVPQVAATANQSNAQETAPPTTALSVQDDHSKSSDMPDGSRESPPTCVVNDEPIFTLGLCDISGANPGETVVLVCRVAARLRPMVLWYRNSQLISVFNKRYEQSYDGDLARLTIRSMDSDVVGVYDCAARNAFGKVTSTCRLQLRGGGGGGGDLTDRQTSSLSGQMAAPPTPRVAVRRSETLPTTSMAMRIINSAARRKMEAGKPLREDTAKRNANDVTAVEVASHPEEVEEEAVARSTRTEKASDGGKVTTTTTITTHKTKDGAHLVTKQTKQITRVGGVGTTNYSINKCSAEEIAERLAGIFEKKALIGTGGVILVKTENWNSQDGITHRNEKSQLWEAPRLALSFNESDKASKGYSGAAGPSSLQRSATTVKQRMLEWCRITLKDYKNVTISNFSTSWNDGMAFCALVHHFIPDAFDYDQLEAKNRRENFQLAFETAEKRAGIVPLLEVEDMVGMTVPDWKCVFMYVQSIYRHFVLPKPLQPRSGNSLD